MERSDSSTPGAPGREHVHVITPGDHYSPRTGSAVPTVVDGLVRGGVAGDAAPSSVVVAAGTYPDRYPGVRVLEYPPATSRPTDRYLDAATSRVGLPRFGARRAFAATVQDQTSWAPSFVLAHNAPQLVPLVDASRHVPVLYAHNQLLRTYSHRELARILGPVHRVVCVSQFLADETASLLPPSLRDRVVVVHNGVDAPADDAVRAPRGEVLHVVFVGRAIPDKGPDVVVDAVRRLDRHDVRLTVVGAAGFDAAAPPTPYEHELRRRAAGTTVPTTFTSFLPRKEVREVLQTADVVVVPSRWAEPFALTALEGMAAGAAVVASDIGGIPEAVGSAGILVPPGDVGALADVLTALAEDETMLERARSAGREHATQMDWSSARARLDQVLGGARARTVGGPS